MAPELVRIVVVDDNAAMLARATAVLTPTCAVVGTAQDGPSALKIIMELQPAVVVLDISLPGMNGFEVAVRLREAQSCAAIVFLSVHAGKEYVDAAHAVGGVGFVVKECLGSDLPIAVHAASGGERFVSLAH